jgi:hypothetical protein
MDHHTVYNRHADAPYGKRYARMVGSAQEKLLRDRTCRDIDAAFERAVEATEILIPVIYLTA